MTDITNSRSEGHKVERDGGERLPFSGMELVIRASAPSTGGAFSIVEEIAAVDAPLHVHEREDELFYVLEGEHVFTVGGVEHRAGPGDAVFAPRGVPHAQRRVIPRTGRTLSMYSPAGFEAFFRDLSAAASAGPLGPDALDAIAGRYGTRWIR